jgi:hypothetical protein
MPHRRRYGGEWWDVFDPNKNGVANALDPNKNGFNREMTKVGEGIVNTAGNAINGGLSLVGVPPVVPKLGSTPGLQEVLYDNVYKNIPIVGDMLAVPGRSVTPAMAAAAAAAQQQQSAYLPMTAPPPGAPQYVYTDGGGGAPAADNTQMIMIGGGILLAVLLLK